MKIIIPSRKRPESHKMIRNLLKDFTFCIGEDDVKDYSDAGLEKNRMLVHPPEIVGLGKKRQWIMDKVDDDIFFLDDDMYKLWFNGGLRGKRIDGWNNVHRVIDNLYQMSKDLGAYAWGFGQAGDVRKFQPFKPFQLNTWVGSAFGVNGRDIRFDINRKTRVDIDFSLKVLEKYRYLLVDNRFAFVGERFKNAGGSQSIRSQESDDLDYRILKERWKGAVRLQVGKTTNMIKIVVPRTQTLSLDK